MDTNISVADSPLDKALDVYFSWLVSIANSGAQMSSNQKLLLNNTITPFDISQDTPYYNEGLFRNFADRVFMGSPQGIGPANRADRFSLHYGRLISQAASRIDRKYSAISTELTAIRNEISTKTTELSNLIVKIEADWNRIGVPKEDPNYELKYLNFLESVRYADQVGSLSDEIDDLIGQMDSVRRSAYSTDEQLILDNLSHLNKTSMIARPRRASFERTVSNVNDLTFADPKVRVDALCDISAPIYPLGDLIKFLKSTGSRDIEITKTSTVTTQHDSQWSAGGSARYGFFSIGGGGSGSSSYRSEITKSNSVKLEFGNVAEYLIDRDFWFNPVVFERPDLLKLFTQIGGLDRFEFVSVSIIIARGLKLTLKFDVAIDESQWTKRQFSASGGVSVFGFSFGASGSNSSYDYTAEVAADKRSVTFKDDPQLTRVLAYRLDPFVKAKSGRLDRATDASVVGAFTSFKTADIGYLELQKAKFR